jgi:transposase
LRATVAVRWIFGKHEAFFQGSLIAVISTLHMAANSAAVKNCYLGDRYRRIAARRGKKRAIVATAHALLVIAYHVLTTNLPYQERGFGRYSPEERERRIKYHLRRLSELRASLKEVPSQ